MPYNVNMIDLIINEAREHKYESPWIEFKTNNCNPQEIGEYISALSNTAALFNQEHAFMIWGIDDMTHDVVGTKFDPRATKVGNQGLDLWISTFNFSTTLNSLLETLKADISCRDSFALLASVIAKSAVCLWAIGTVPITSLL